MREVLYTMSVRNEYDIYISNRRRWHRFTLLLWNYKGCFNPPVDYDLKRKKSEFVFKQWRNIHYTTYYRANTNTSRLTRKTTSFGKPPGSCVIADKMLKSGQFISAAHIPPHMLMWPIPFQHKALSTHRYDLSPAPDELRADWQLIWFKQPQETLSGHVWIYRVM